MSSETAFITALRAIATSSAARGLADDAAVLVLGSERLVLTMDAIVEGVHFLPDDPAETVAWKLVASNVSDLAAKGARPTGCLLTYPLASDRAWDAAFLQGLDHACATFAIPLMGGDTVRQPPGSARSFSLVAIGQPDVGVAVPSRSGAKAGDDLWVSGVIGDAGLGLALLEGRCHAPAELHALLVASYRQPRPSPALGIALAPHVTAMMDISDGVLIDSARLASASDAAAAIELKWLPLSDAHVAVAGETLEARLAAACAGDDYGLLFTAPQAARERLLAIATDQGQALRRIGQIAAGSGLSLTFLGAPVAVPERLGFEH